MNYTDDHVFEFYQYINLAQQLRICKYCNEYILFYESYSENTWKMIDDPPICISANEKIIKDIIE